MIKTRGAASADRRTFHTLLNDWATAIVANDADRIAEFTEPDWELIDPASGPIPLTRFLHVVREGELTHTEMMFDVLSVRAHGDIAVVIAYGTNKGERRGEPFSAREWVSEIFVRRDGDWRCQLSALTPDVAATLS